MDTTASRFRGRLGAALERTDVEGENLIRAGIDGLVEPMDHTVIRKEWHLGERRDHL